MTIVNYNEIITKLQTELASPKWFEEFSGRAFTIHFRALLAIRDGLELHKPSYEPNTDYPLCEECTAISYRRESWPCETALTLSTALSK